MPAGSRTALAKPLRGSETPAEVKFVPKMLWLMIVVLGGGGGTPGHPRAQGHSPARSWHHPAPPWGVSPRSWPPQRGASSLPLGPTEQRTWGLVTSGLSVAASVGTWVPWQGRAGLSPGWGRAAPLPMVGLLVLPGVPAGGGEQRGDAGSAGTANPTHRSTLRGGEVQGFPRPGWFQQWVSGCRYRAVPSHPGSWIFPRDI